MVPLLILLTGAMWGFFVHANLRWRLGWLERVIATPAFHHWHHTRHDHANMNCAPMLPFMDMIFGSFYLPKHVPADYGTDTPVSPGILGQLINPFEPPAAPLDARSGGMSSRRAMTSIGRWVKGRGAMIAGKNPPHDVPPLS
jgi:fatty acid hydroxylase family protein